MGFTVGSTVEWESQAGGSSTVKRGEIVAVVLPGVSGSGAVRRLMREGNFRSNFGGGAPRNHESYVVAVTVGGEKAARVLYWPRVAALRLVEGRYEG